MDNREILVSIRCLAYNQVRYIRQCLDGFVMQKTNFRFEAIVHDDASTDGTTEIIKEYAEKYPDIIKPIYEKENQYSKDFSVIDSLVRKACVGKYLAFCEGDDFWTDPLKLQKQVDILETNPDVTFVHTAFSNVDMNGHIFHRKQYEYYQKISRCGSVLPLLLKQNYVMTMSLCIRNEIMESRILINCPQKMDYAYTLACASLGKAYYLPENTCCYRMNPAGAMATSSSSVHKISRQIFLYFAQLYTDRKITKLRKIEDIKAKHEILIKCLGMLKAKLNEEEVHKFLQTHKQLFFLLPSASVIALYRQIIVKLHR